MNCSNSLSLDQFICADENHEGKGNHAYIVCTHIDKAHIHNHVIWNSTALDEQSKFRNFWGSTKAIRRLSDTSSPLMSRG